MQTVELVRAKRGAKKVSCTMTLQAHCGLDLAAAKGATDAMLLNEHPTVSLPSKAAARSLIVALAELGVVARFAEGPDYNPRERLDSALASVEALLEPEVLGTCRSLSGHGEWELGLSCALDSLSKQTDSDALAAVEMLSQLGVEFGMVRG
jgi:hypothetical protein